MANGKSVQLYLVDGTPGGLVIAEIFNWTGKVLSCPRAQLDSLLKRNEVEGTGVYILLGDDPDNITKPIAYVGETDEVRRRIKQHSQQDNDWWNRVIAITNKDLNITKAHVRYLEHHIIVKAREANRSTVRNGNLAVPSSLPEAATSDMNQFMSQVELILPLLNVNILRKPLTVSASKPKAYGFEKTTDKPTLFEFHNPKRGLKASAQEVDGEFVVLAGSEAAVGYSQPNHSYTGLKSRLETDGTLHPTPDSLTLEFSTDFSFSSPSAAAAVVAGRPSNGRTDWRVIGTGQTYNSWQESKIDEEIGREIN